MSLQARDRRVRAGLLSRPTGHAACRHGMRRWRTMGSGRWRKYLNAKFVEVPCVDRRRCVRQRISTRLRLRERNDFTNVVSPASRAVRRSRPKANPPCGGVVLERIDEEAELRSPFRFTDTQQLEDPVLDIGAVDPDRARGPRVPSRSGPGHRTGCARRGGLRPRRRAGPSRPGAAS